MVLHIMKLNIWNSPIFGYKTSHTEEWRDINNGAENLNVTDDLLVEFPSQHQEKDLNSLTYFF
jgi:hypothetical protein